MTKALRSDAIAESVAKKQWDLLAIAVKAIAFCEDGRPKVLADGAAVLWDAVNEMQWAHPFVMGLLLGVPLDDVPPAHLRTRESRTEWRRKRKESLKFATSQTHLYRDRSDWVRAVHAALLFGNWATAQAERYESRCPWPLVRHNATADARAQAQMRKAQREAWAAERTSMLASRAYEESVAALALPTPKRSGG